MRKVLAVSLLFSSQILWAQSPTAAHPPLAGDNEQQRRLEQENFENWALDSDTRHKKAATAKEKAETAEFYFKAKHFVQLWQALAAELNEKNTFNAKLAKQVSKAFHDLEKSDGWPVGRPK
jgi:hypothetical protein